MNKFNHLAEHSAQCLGDLGDPVTWVQESWAFWVCICSGKSWNPGHRSPAGLFQTHDLSNFNDLDENSGPLRGTWEANTVSGGSPANPKETTDG
jgi:hypothetical protein